MLAREIQPNSARRRIFDGAAEAKLIALTLSGPEDFARWNLRLLEEEGCRTAHCRARQRQLTIPGGR